jgi:protoporphyrinogen oxidase
MSKPTIGILGGGALGLAAAYKLTQQGYQVEILERLEYKGGLAGCVKIGDSYLERFYHHFFLSDTTLIQLCNELGIGDNLLWLDSKIGHYYDGKIYPFGTPLEILQFSPLSFFDRLRFGISGLYLSQLSNREMLDSTSARDWFIKYSGKAAYKKVWEPLLIHKFGKYHTELPIAWLWKKLQLRGSSRKSRTSKEKLGYLKGSLAVFNDAIARKIEAQGGRFIHGVNVKKIKQQDGKIIVEAENQTYEYDKVIATFAPEIFTSITENLSAEYLNKAKNLFYTGVVCTILVLKKSFTPFYWINIADTQLPFNGLIEQTNFLPKEMYGNRHVLYISNYCYTTHPHYSMTQDELLKIYIAGLKKVNPSFDENDIEEVIMSRAAFAQPVVRVNYPDLIPPLETNIKGLFNVSMAHLYPEDRGVNYSLKSGLEIADTIISGK